MLAKNKFNKLGFRRLLGYNKIIYYNKDLCIRFSTINGTVEISSYGFSSSTIDRQTLKAMNKQSKEIHSPFIKLIKYIDCVIFKINHKIKDNRHVNNDLNYISVPKCISDLSSKEQYEETEIKI